MRRMLATVTLGTLAVLATGCGGASSAPSSATGTPPASAAASQSADVLALAAPFTGTYSGGWQDSFGTSGNVTLVLATDASSKSGKVTLTFTGPVFGQGVPVPPAETFTVPLDGKLAIATGGGLPTNGTVTYSSHSTNYGDFTGTLASDGTLSITFTNVPSGGISKCVVTGKLTAGWVGPQMLNFNLTLTDGTTATGTVTVAKA